MTDQTRVIVDTKFAVLAEHRFDGDVPIVMSVKGVELEYGTISLDISVNIPYENGLWESHPFMYANMKGKVIGEVLENTPAVRELIHELGNPIPKKMYTTTDICHRARLISAIRMFWS